MSVIPSLSTILSLLSFLTTVFALARVGAAAFSANNRGPEQHDSHRGTEEGGDAHRGATTAGWAVYSKAAAQPAAHLLQLQLGGAPGSGTTMSFAQAVRFGLNMSSSSSEKNRDSDRDREKGKEVGYIGGHDLVRMPASTWTGARRPGLLFRPPSPFPDQTKPLSMAKLIMSRHQNQRKQSRPPVVRRPPGLPSSPSSRSRLVEQV